MVYFFPKTKKNNCMDSIKIVVLTALVLGLVVYVVWVDLGSTRRNVPSIIDMLIINRADGLFENVPLHGGKEWKTLTAEELFAILVESANAIQKNKRNTFEGALGHYKERCESLSLSMSNNQSRPFYKDSDMSYLIEKPLDVGRMIKETYL